MLCHSWNNSWWEHIYVCVFGGWGVADLNSSIQFISNMSGEWLIIKLFQSVSKNTAAHVQQQKQAEPDNCCVWNSIFRCKLRGENSKWQVFFSRLKVVSSKVGLKHIECANGIPIMRWAPLRFLLFTFTSHRHCVLLKLDHSRTPEGPVYINKTKLPWSSNYYIYMGPFWIQLCNTYCKHKMIVSDL